MKVQTTAAPTVKFVVDNHISKLIKFSLESLRWKMNDLARYVKSRRVSYAVLLREPMGFSDECPHMPHASHMSCRPETRQELFSAPIPTRCTVSGAHGLGCARPSLCRIKHTTLLHKNFLISCFLWQPVYFTKINIPFLSSGSWTWLKEVTDIKNKTHFFNTIFWQQHNN